MTDERPDGGGGDESRLRARLRLVAGAVVLLMVVFLVVVDSLGRLLIRPDFHVGDIFLGSLLCALLVLVVGEGAGKFLGGGK